MTFENEQLVYSPEKPAKGDNSMNQANQSSDAKLMGSFPVYLDPMEKQSQADRLTGTTATNSIYQTNRNSS